MPTRVSRSGEEGPQQVLQRALQVGEGQVLVDGEAFDLVEDEEVRGVDGVAPVAAAERDHVDRRIALFHLVDLRGGGLRAEDDVAVEVEGVQR